MAKKGGFKLMRTIFTNEDMSSLLQDVFNDNTIDVTLIDADTEEKTESDMVSYLNVEFYTWWRHATSSAEDRIDSGANVFESWKDSLNYSMDKSFALIEQTDEETISSQDIVGATILGRTTFLINANKVSNLEYYIRYLKGLYTGKPITRQASNGKTIAGYLTLGVLLYDTEPEQTQYGNMITAIMNWKFAYMKRAGNYSDIPITFSLDNTNYYDMIITKYNWQNIFTTEAVPRAGRVDLTGVITTAITQNVTISFFDFDESEFAYKLNNDYFWNLGAIEIDDEKTETQDVNIPIYVKVSKLYGSAMRIYKYKFVLTDFQKVLVNNDFTISSITLKTWGKGE